MSRPAANGSAGMDGATSRVSECSATAARGLEQRAALVGRRADLDAVREALARERLVTLVGSAGVGKSRLAQEVLALELSVPTQPRHSCRSNRWTASSMCRRRSRWRSACPMAAEGDRFQSLRRALEGACVLLVLDGAEHLAGELAGPLVALVARARGLRILVTSQTPLGRPGEAVYRLDPLPLAEAAGLFALRAAQADRRFLSQAGAMRHWSRRSAGSSTAIRLPWSSRLPASRRLGWQRSSGISTTGSAC